MRQAKGVRIMIVDDEACIADSLAIIFRNSGYEAVAYYDGDTALRACEEGAPDLLLTDVIMPGLDGIELAILMKKQYPGCRVLLISGLGTSFDLLEQAERRGFHFEILEKPTPPDELLKTIAAALGRGSPLPFPKRTAGIRRERARDAS
jgi:DNA-binding NtrC family response regulator